MQPNKEIEAKLGQLHDALCYLTEGEKHMEQLKEKVEQDQQVEHDKKRNDVMSKMLWEIKKDLYLSKKALYKTEEENEQESQMGVTLMKDEDRHN